MFFSPKELVLETITTKDFLYPITSYIVAFLIILLIFTLEFHTEPVEDLTWCQALES